MIKKSILLVLILFQFSCTDKQKILSVDEFPYHDGSGEVHYRAYSLTNARTFQAEVSRDKGRFLQLGSYQDFESYFAIRFPVDSAEGIVIDSAWLWLGVNHVYKEAPGEIEAEIYPILNDWREVEFPSLQIGEESFAEATFSSEDTLYDVVTIPKEVVQEWVENPHSNFGFVVKYASADIMKEYNSYEGNISEDYEDAITTLKLLVHDSDNTEPVSITSISYPDIAFISGIDEVPQERLIVDNWRVYRQFIRFTIDSISQDAFVNDAVLLLHIDPEQSIIKNEYDISISTHPVISDNWMAGEPAFLDSVQYYSSYSQQQVAVDVTTAVQLWIGNITPNYGMVLRSNLEGDDISRFVFYSSEADTSLEPKLYMRYTLPVRRY